MPGGRPRKGTTRREMQTAKLIAARWRKKELFEQRAKEALVQRLKSEKSASQLYFEQLRAQTGDGDGDMQTEDIKMDVEEEDSTQFKLEGEDVEGSDGGVEDEEAIPFSQIGSGSGEVVTDKLTLRIIAPPEVTKRRQLTTVDVPVPPRKQLPPAPKNCFVCRRLLSRFDASQITRGHCLFLLIDLLGVTRTQANLTLDEMGKPETWIGLCQLCHRLIIDGAKDREEIRKLKASIKKRQQMFRYKFKPDLSLKVCGKGNPAFDKIWDLIQSQEKTDPLLDEDECPEPLAPVEASTVFYCGLCTDDKVYSSEAELQFHTDEAHPPDPMGAENSGETNSPVSKPEKEGLYSCPTCPEVKRYDINRIAQHLAIHQRLPYRCSLCHSFLSEDELQREQHWTDKHPDAKLAPLQEKFVETKVIPGSFWRCKGCSVGFSEEGLRNLHERKCSEAKAKTIPKRKDPLPYSCSACKKRSRNSDEWRLHRILHHPEMDRISCLYCDAAFKGEGEKRDEEKMLLHIKDHHKWDKPKHPKTLWSESFFIDQIFEECEPCGSILVAGKSVQKHFREKHKESNASPFFCPVCRKGFGRRLTLKLHGEQHHFGQESICDFCGATFKGLTNLLDHKVREHDFNPGPEHPVFICKEPGCQYKTAIKRKFVGHSKNVHAPQDSFKCKYCGKGFKNLCHIKEHERIHENKESKPHQCEICGNSFALKNYLYIHKRLSHEGRTFPSTNKKKGPRSKAKKKSGPDPTEAVNCTVQEDPTSSSTVDIDGSNVLS